MKLNYFTLSVALRHLRYGVGQSLLEYAQETGEWDAVVTAFVDGWASEYQLTNG